MPNFKDFLDEFKLSDILESLDQDKVKASMQSFDSKLGKIITVGEAGGGLVKVEINGFYNIRSCQIDPSLLTPDNQTTLQDLFVAAFNIAHKNITTEIQKAGQQT